MAQLKTEQKTAGIQIGGVSGPGPRGEPVSPQLSAIVDRLQSGRDLASKLTRYVSHGRIDGASPIFVSRPDGTLLYANEAFNLLRDALGPEATRTFPQLVAEQRERTPPAQPKRLEIELDGKRRPFVIEHDLLRDSGGKVIAIIGRLSSADETRRLRDRLRASEDRFTDIARLVSDWIWETDRELRLTYVSPRVIAALGYHPRELLGRRFDSLAVSPDDLSDIAGTEPAPFRGREATLRHRDGRSRRFRLSGLPVFGRERGELLGFRGTAWDVTELAAHEAALQEAVEAAEAANRTKSQFLANTSHELRTPLNAIIGFTEIMHQERFGPIGSPRYVEYVSDVLESAHHLLTLINDILDVAKIEAGKLELDETVADPVALCRQALRLVADRAARHEVNLREDLPRDLPKLLIDERKIKQVLLNLLSNAIKFTPKDGMVELSARRAADGSFCLIVRDTGIGIASEDQATAMMPFGQVENQLSRKFEGTGLGLPLSDAMAQLHGGSLELDSVPERGTVVTVRLPSKRVAEA